MLLYDNAPADRYEEIKTWYPVWYQEVVEMDALWRAWAKHMDEAQKGVIQAVDNNFVDYVDAQTIAILEQFYHLIQDRPRTLAERRNLIKAFMIGGGHIGRNEIIELISIFTDGDIEVSFDSGIIHISVLRSFADPFNLYDFHLILDSRIPAHLGLNVIDTTHPVTVFNHNAFIFRALKILATIRSYIGALARPAITFSGLRVIQGYDFSGKVLIDNPFFLDGIYTLDGTRRLSGGVQLSDT